MAKDQYFWIFLLVVFGSRKSVPKFELWLLVSSWSRSGDDALPEFVWLMAQSFGNMEKNMMKALWNHQRLPFAALGDGSSCPVNDYQLWGVFMVLFSNQNWLKVKHYRKHLHFIRKKLKLPGKKSPWINRLREKTDGHSKKKRTRDRQRNMWLKGPKQCWRWIRLRPSPIL